MFYHSVYIIQIRYTCFIMKEICLLNLWKLPFPGFCRTQFEYQWCRLSWGDQRYINQTFLITLYVALWLMCRWIPWWSLLLQQLGNNVVNWNRIHTFSVLWWYEFWISLMWLFMNAVLTYHSENSSCYYISCW